MLTITENKNLKKHNTFGMEVSAKVFIEWNDPSELHKWLISNTDEHTSLLILGGGSNILFTENFDGIVIHGNSAKIEILGHHDNKVMVSVDAGVEWDYFIEWCVDHGFSGLENLSLIPGSTGASPIQNIGAYGVEVASYIDHVSGINLLTGQGFIYSNQECRFGYRTSIFKEAACKNHLITQVVFSLNQHFKPVIDYKDLQQELVTTSYPDAKTIREAVIRIRRKKLPDPKVLGNAGSFFKNPEIDSELYDQIRASYPDLSGFPMSDNRIKIAAAWLIDKCGLKGYRSGQTGTHANQPLVIINHGRADGLQILQLAEKIEESVRQKFGVSLEKEVTVI